MRADNQRLAEDAALFGARAGLRGAFLRCAATRARFCRGLSRRSELRHSQLRCLAVDALRASVSGRATWRIMERGARGPSSRDDSCVAAVTTVSVLPGAT